jgi:hypothetical protein
VAVRVLRRGRLKVRLPVRHRCPDSQARTSRYVIHLIYLLRLRVRHPIPLHPLIRLISGNKSDSLATS